MSEWHGLATEIHKVLSAFLAAHTAPPQISIAPIEASPIPDGNGEPPQCETLSRVEINGTNPAISTCTDLDRTSDLSYVPLTPGAGESEGEGVGPLVGKTGETFQLSEPQPKPRAAVFNPILFAEFWTAYPRKVGRLAAVKAFTRIAPTRAMVDRMIAAIAVQRASRQWRDGFIPHASSWLNGERWTDEIEADPPPPPGSSAAKRIARLEQAIGPRAEGGTWRDRCTHDPPCETPTACGLRRAREITL